MVAAVVDTHAALWYVFGDARLSRAAKAFLDMAAVERRKVAVSAISLAEIVYLVEKQRLPLISYERLRLVLGRSDYVLVEAPLTVSVIDSMRHVSRLEVPDMPDRLVAATALSFGVPVVTRDGRIRATNLQTIW
jgi:PIN domain nuclease of toxin-antitoxin system